MTTQASIVAWLQNKPEPLVSLLQENAGIGDLSTYPSIARLETQDASTATG